MDFIDEIRTLAARIPKQLPHIQTEEATKSAFVMPFINALGYNVFDPLEVIPELTADVGIKKGEKVDYAITKDGKIIMLFECKWCGADLDKITPSQLFRYFMVTDARIGVLTNGVIYQFYTDLESPNKMDTKPFLVFDMRNIQEPLVSELKKLSKQSFDLDEMISTASELKYTREIKRLLQEQLTNPSEEFIKFIVGHVYAGLKNKKVVEQFAPIVKSALNQFISDGINERLKTALNVTQATEKEPAPSAPPPVEPAEPEDQNRLETTALELEGYYIVKSILRDLVDPARIAHRDTQSYFGILLDDTRLKTICRLLFNNPTNLRVEIFTADKKSEKIPIQKLDDLYKLSDRLKEIVKRFETSKAPA